jgi:HD-like signal output (HDOD) protein
VSTLTLSDVDKKLEDLPLLPSVVAKLLSLSPYDEEYFEKVVSLAKEDPPFALRVIRLSNAASSSPASAISDIRRAVVRVGAHKISDLIASMAVMRVFFPKTQREKYMWVHSIRTAVASKTIARMAPSLRVDPEEAYLCGLLTDIGRFVLMDIVPKKAGYEDKNDWVPSRELVDIEMNLYGFDHAELGARVCVKWGMPHVVTTVVKYHHQFQLPKILSNDAKLSNILRVVQTGDSFGAFIILNPESSSWDPRQLQESLEEYCIRNWISTPSASSEQLAANLEKVVSESDKIISLLGIALH